MKKLVAMKSGGQGISLVSDFTWLPGFTRIAPSPAATRLGWWRTTDPFHRETFVAATWQFKARMERISTETYTDWSPILTFVVTH